MSDEPKPKDNPAQWSMPEPVYRTSEGHTPGKAPETAGADAEDDVITEEIDTDPPSADIDITEPAPMTPAIADADKPAPTPARAKRGCFKKFAYVVGAIVLFLIAALIALIYFLFYYRGADTGTF